MILEILVLCSIARLVFTFLLASSPLLIGLWVLLIAFSLAGWIGVIGISWFGLILFLIYVGGMLVIFIYFVAITPNQQHDSKIFFMRILIFIIFLRIGEKIRFINRFNIETSFNRDSILFYFSQGAVLVLIFIMLFVGLIIVVKITRLVQGPLRPFR